MRKRHFSEEMEKPSPDALLLDKGSSKDSFGGRYKTRTCDLPHVKRMRYQLRQSSIADSSKKYYTAKKNDCQDLFLCLRCFSRTKPDLIGQVLLGAGNEARTRYLHLGKVALYRMSYARRMEAPPGFEPGSRGFAVPCLTTWLWRQKSWCLGSESNQRHADFQSAALPTELPRHTRENGAGNEARTRYLHLGKVALYRMSYARKWRPRRDLNPRPPA